MTLKYQKLREIDYNKFKTDNLRLGAKIKPKELVNKSNISNLVKSFNSNT